MTIDAMCLEARKTVANHVSRSAGQHLRAMHTTRNAGAPTGADIYAMTQESDTAYRLAPWLCKQAGISYPPQQPENVCQ